MGGGIFDEIRGLGVSRVKGFGNQHDGLSYGFVCGKSHCWTALRPHLRLGGNGHSWSASMLFVPAVLSAFNLVIDIQEVGFCKDWKFTEAQIEGTKRF